MRSKEPKVRAESDYYLYTPSATACRLYLYPICLGQFFYEAGYSISRSHYDSFLLMYVAKGCCHLQFENQSVTALKDQVILLDCYSPHEYGFPQDSEIYWIHFDGPLAREYYNTITEDRGYAFSVKNLYPVTHNIPYPGKQRISAYFPDIKRTSCFAGRNRKFSVPLPGSGKFSGLYQRTFQ